MYSLYHRGVSIITVLITALMLSTTLLAQDSSEEDWKKAQAEMKAMFGTVPVMFAEMPAHVRVSSWNWFKTTQFDPNAAIPPKYAELMSLAVASQIPCGYCIYAHTTMARMLGATDEEIKEAVMKAGEVRNWSTVLNGNSVDFEKFKTQWDAILAFVKSHSKKESQ